MSKDPQDKKQPQDHDDFGSDRSKIVNVIDSKGLERDSREKPVPTFSRPAPAPFSPEDMARRNRRSIALALVLGGLVLFFFIVTLAKTGPAILNRPL